MSAPCTCPRITGTLAALLPADVDDYGPIHWELLFILMAYKSVRWGRDERAAAGKDVSWDTDAHLWAWVLADFGLQCQHPEEWRKPYGAHDPNLGHAPPNPFECEACGELGIIMPKKPRSVFEDRQDFPTPEDEQEMCERLEVLRRRSAPHYARQRRLLV